MLQLLQPTTGNIVSITASGTVTAEDYESVLIPAIEETLKFHDKVRVLFQLETNTGFTAGAVWDDTKFGLSHFFSFEKFALVSDTEWLNNTVKVVGFMIPCPVRLFALADLDAARVATVVAYCLTGLRSFLDYLLIHRVASDRTLTLDDINREVIAAYLGFLDDGMASTGAQRSRYGHVKPVLMALGQRGLIPIVTEGDEATFPANPFPHSHRKAKGESPLTLAQRREFTAAVKTAVSPLLTDSAAPTAELLAYALLVVALHTGRNLTPLLEMGTNCLRAHPRDNMVFLVCYKRRGNAATKVPLREEKAIESISSALSTVA